MADPKTWQQAVQSWQAPLTWKRVDTIDAHTAGEPLRIYVDGFPDPIGQSILERRNDAMQRFERYRTGTMWEPRGHADMYGCLIVPAERMDSDFGVLFLHNQGYSSMCGHGIIAVATIAVQIGWIPANDQSCIPITIDAPAGQIRSVVHIENDRVAHVSFENVPSFVDSLDQSVPIPEIGTVSYDLAFGGAYYAYVDADALGLDLEQNNQAQIVEWGRLIKNAVMKTTTIEHPLHDDLSFLYGTLFTSASRDSANHSRHVCVFADGEVDRSPTGTGVSGRAAILWERKQIDRHESITIESILGTTFDVQVQSESLCGSRSAITPRVTGSASITGRHQFVFDPSDPLTKGFLLR